MPRNIVEELRRRVIKNFMDILTLTEIRNCPLSGYDIISFIYKKFGILVSSGTVYSLLYSMERKGLIEGVQNQRRRVYTITEKGEQSMMALAKANNEIQSFLRNKLLPNDYYPPK